MHYTINKNWQGIADRPTAVYIPVYIPGHKIGKNTTRHIVTLEDGDTADNPTSSKKERVLHGPGLVVYDVAPTGITVTEYDDAKGFYDSILRPFPWQLNEFVSMVFDAQMRDELPPSAYVGELLKSLGLPVPSDITVNN